MGVRRIHALKRKKKKLQLLNQQVFKFSQFFKFKNNELFYASFFLSQITCVFYIGIPAKNNQTHFN